MWEKIEALGLEFHCSPLPHGGYRASIIWDKPKFKQIMAQESRAMIVYTEGESLEQTIKRAEVALMAWLNAHEEVNK